MYIIKFVRSNEDRKDPDRDIQSVLKLSYSECGA
jgi:hypothetical protein